MSIPIAGTTPIEDPEYRYQMPPVQAKIEGRGNGIKTVMLNIMEVASALHREPLEITKFFGCEFGSQTNFSSEKCTMNGVHTPQELQNSLTRYIEKFVLCPNCKLPETTYKIKNKVIFHRCFACGAKEPVDMTHKITTAILSINEKKGATKKKDKLETIASETKDGDLPDDGKAKKKKKSKSSKDTNGLEAEANDKEKKDKKKKKDKEKEKDKKEDKEKKEKKDKKKKDKKKHKKHDSEHEGGSDSKIEDEFKATSAVIDDMNVLDNGANLLRQFLQQSPKPTEDEIIRELSHIQKLLALPIYSRIYILLFSLFNENMTSNCTQVANSEKLLQYIISDHKDIQRHTIGAIELFCARKFTQLKLKIPILLKYFYDNDLIKEEIIFEWYNEPERSVIYSPILLEDSDLIDIKTATRPMIDWLKEDNDDSDVDDDDSDDDEDDDDEEEDEQEKSGSDSRSHSNHSESELPNENFESKNNETNDQWIDDI